VKSIERPKIKENEFAHSVARTREIVTERPREVATIVIAVVAVAVVAGGFFAWKANRDNKATTLLATALTVVEAPVVTPPPPAPGSAPPVQPPGSFRTDRERLEAAVPVLQRAADAYPDSDAGITARYRLAAVLAELGRGPEAEQRYQEVIQKAGGKSIYRYTARLGLGEAQLAQGKGDAAVATFRDLSTDTNSNLPVDGVLMQLGRAALIAGKKEDATRAFTRVVDEFPQSLYAAEAKEKIAELKKA
jgi:tetratricopeptide (TPR) repeat protein